MNRFIPPALPAWRLAPAAVAFALAVAVQPASTQQPCNPVIDGTFCATQMPAGRGARQPPPAMSPIRDLGRSISGEPTNPATLGSISFRGGGSTCIGLLRRGACN